MVGKDLIMATLFGSGGGSGGGGSGAGGWPEVPDDGATYLYITLAEGRTSPMLGVGVNGTVTVDWGDGTEQDVLTGPMLAQTQFTPKHEYGKPGDYVIRITVDGEAKLSGLSGARKGAEILRHSSGDDGRNYVYRNALKKLRIGEGVTIVGSYSLQNCQSLTSVIFSDSVTTVETFAFTGCTSLTTLIVTDSVKSFGGTVFSSCYSLRVCDFTACTDIPSLYNTSVFSDSPSDFEIRVPAALYDEWVAETNWATYADKIKAY